MTTETQPTMAVRTETRELHIPRRREKYTPTKTAKYCLKQHLELPATAEDVAEVVEGGEVAHVDRKPAVNGEQIELTYHGSIRGGHQIAVDVAPTTDPFGPTTQARSGPVEMKVLRVRRPHEPYTDPIDTPQPEDDEDDADDRTAGQAWPKPN